MYYTSSKIGTSRLLHTESDKPRIMHLNRLNARTYDQQVAHYFRCVEITF